MAQVTKWNASQITDTRLNQQTIFWDTTNPVSGVPASAFFLNISTGILYRNTGSEGTPTWTKVIQTTVLPSGTTLFTDAYTTNTGWTQTGTLVTVDSGVADKIAFVAALDGTDRRVSKSLSTTTPPSYWKLDTTFNPTAATTPAHLIIGLTAGTGNPYTATQHMVGIEYNDTTSNGLCVAYKDGSGTVGNSTERIAAATGSTYYISLEQIRLGYITLSVYSDSGRTSHVSGSPISTYIPTGISMLTTIQHSVASTGGGTRSLTATLDDTTLYS